MVAAISLLLHPGIVWLIGTKVAGLTVDQLRSAVIAAAMAPGIVSIRRRPWSGRFLL